MIDNLRRELKGFILFLPLASVSLLLVFVMVGPGMAGSGGLFESPTSPLPVSPISPISPVSPTPSPVEVETVGPSVISPILSPVAGETVGPPTLPPLIAVRTQPNYWPWVLGGLVIIGGVVGVMRYRRGRGDEG